MRRERGTSAVWTTRPCYATSLAALACAYEQILADASPQFRQPENGNLALLGADETLVYEIAQHLVDALARGAHQRRQIALCQLHINADAVRRANTVQVGQIEQLLCHAPMHIQEEQVFNHRVGLAETLREH